MTDESGCEVLNPEMYRTIVENVPTGVYVVDLARRIQVWSRGAEELTGYLRQEVIGRVCFDDLLMHCDERGKCFCGQACPLERSMHDGKARTAEVFLRHKDGQRIPVHLRVTPLRNEHDNIVGAIEWFDRRVVLSGAGAWEPPEDVARDPITGLADRDAVAAFIGRLLETWDESAPFGVLVATLEGLEQARHTRGEKAVEALLHGTGQTLANALGPYDLIGRWSEESFVVVLTGATAASLERAAHLMNRLGQLVGVSWWGERIRAGVRIAEALARAGDTPEELVGRARAALPEGVPVARV